MLSDMNSSPKLSPRKFPVSITASLETRNDWIVSVTDDPNPINPETTDRIFTFNARSFVEAADPRNWESPMHHLDLFEMRAQLLTIENEEHALSFLRTYGPLALQGRTYAGETAPVRLSRLLWHIDRHTAYLYEGSVKKHLAGNARKALDATIVAVFDHYASMPLEAKLIIGEKSSAAVICKDIEEASRAIALLSRLEGFKLGKCKHCRKMFQRITARKTRYCGDRCRSAATSERHRLKLKRKAKR
jgi:hypothetical protein